MTSAAGGNEQLLFGQERSAGLIIEALRTVTGKKPLTMHFCGENGVGKSHAAWLLGKAMFQYSDTKSDNPRGMLWISGKEYQFVKEAEEVRIAREKIRKLIFDHLANCEHGVVVVDEAEMVKSDILKVLGEFMDDTHMEVRSRDGKSSVSLKNAVIILISDFGRDEVTWDRSWEAISDRVHAETMKILQSPQMVNRIQFTIPFLPIENVNCTNRRLNGIVPVAVIQQVKQLLGQIHNHRFLAENKVTLRKLDADATLIAGELVRMLINTEEVCAMNYRGIEHLFVGRVLTRVLKKIETALASARSQQQQSRGSGGGWFTSNSLTSWSWIASRYAGSGGTGDVGDREVQVTIRVPFEQSDVRILPRGSPTTRDEL